MDCQCCNGYGKIDPFEEHAFECKFCKGEGEINLFKWLWWEFAIERFPLVAGVCDSIKRKLFN